MKSIKTKILACTLGLLIIGGPVAVKASATYGSKVNIGGVYKYGYAWTKLRGSVVRTRIVIGGDVSDVTLKDSAPTEQVSSWYTKTAYINHYVGSRCIASVRK